MSTSKAKYVGVDWSKAGWFSIGLDDNGYHESKLIPEFRDLLGYYSNASLILVDIPIGLFEAQQGTRDCDTQARKFLTSMGGHSGSVFPAPNRKLAQEALRGRVDWKDSKVVYADSGNQVDTLWGKGVNSQTFAFTRATGEVDGVMGTQAPDRPKTLGKPTPRYVSAN